MLYIRWQLKTLINALKTRRVLILAGPRQCGKTTLAKMLGPEKPSYRTLDDPTLLEAAQSDPKGFIQHGDELMIIDEIQRAPILLSVIKQNVDIHLSPGRFLLTGSANIQMLPSVTESLAGRVRKIRLRPLAMGEIYHKQPDFLTRIFSLNFQTFKTGDLSEFNKDAYIQEAFRGGYPEARTFEQLADSKQWYLDYAQALLERDLRDIANITRHDRMEQLLKVLAAWSSKFMDFSAIGAGLGLSRQTLHNYINALEALFLIERVPAFKHTDYDRIGKQDKLFMTDTGLMTSVLGWHFDQVQFDGDKNGKLLETFVFTQLTAEIDVHAHLYQLYHYRDREQHEIDFIIEKEDGALIGIEVKAGSVINQDSFKHLKWFKERIAGTRSFIGIVLYTGELVLSFSEKMWAIPIGALWAYT